MRYVAPTTITLALLSGLLLPERAWASGLELLPGGAKSVARGGAVAARPEDPMTLFLNPAGLAFLPDGQNQIILDFDTPFHNMCVDPYGYYGWGADVAGNSEFGDPFKLDNATNPTIGATYATTPLGPVCNSAKSLPIPQLAWAGKVGENLGLGAGFVAPVGIGGLQYGGEDGTIQTPYGPRPTPTRYSLIKTDASFALAPSAGAAYRILPELSAGLTATIIMLNASTTGVQNFASGTQPSTDMFLKASAHDYFMPALTFAVHGKPTKNLNVMGAFRWTDSFRGSGEVEYETNTFHRGATSGPVPYQNAPVKLSDVTVRVPWEITVGARYAGMLSDNCGPGDPMDTEQWDVEADITYDLNARAGTGSVTVGQDVTVITRKADGTAGSNTVKQSDVGAFNADEHLLNSYAVRLGGSYAVLPRRLTVHAGGYYESRGVDPAYADIDTFAFQRIGLGTGLVFRLGSFDLQAAYSHIFSETLDIAPPPHQNVEDNTYGNPQSGFDQRVGGTIGNDGTRTGGVVLPDPSAPAPGQGDATASKTQRAALAPNARPNRVINAGRYTASFDIVSVGVVYHF